MLSLPPAQLDRTMRQLTIRAVATGMVLGGLLSLCNLYSGLKIGWSNNMSVTAALLGFAFWRALASARAIAPFTLLESNVSQTAASAGAAISSAGLVAPIPALTFRLVPLQGFSTAANSQVPHNALHDARALREHMLGLEP